MSADNYYRIMPHNGKYAAVMGFASDDTPPFPTSTSNLFDTWKEAQLWAQQQDSEYGVSVDVFCYIRSLEERVDNLERHPLVARPQPDTAKINEMCLDIRRALA